MTRGTLAPHTGCTPCTYTHEDTTRTWRCLAACEGAWAQLTRAPPLHVFNVCVCVCARARVCVRARVRAHVRTHVAYVRCASCGMPSRCSCTASVHPHNDNRSIDMHARSGNVDYNMCTWEACMHYVPAAMSLVQEADNFWRRVTVHACKPWLRNGGHGCIQPTCQNTWRWEGTHLQERPISGLSTRHACQLTLLGAGPANPWAQAP